MGSLCFHHQATLILEYSQGSNQRWCYLCRRRHIGQNSRRNQSSGPVYKGNEGFSLRFEYLEVKTIEGEIRDEQTGKPIKANVTWENKKTGEILATTTSNPSDGKFKIEAPVYVNKPNAEFTLSTYINNYFFKEIFIKTKDIESLYTEPIRIVLPKLEKGKKKLLKEKAIGEDEEKSSEKNVQTITDNHIKTVEEKVSLKEKEIMTIWTH